MDQDWNYVITCSRESENELISAECEALTGGRPNDLGIARGRANMVSQAAFLKAGVKVLERAQGLEELATRVAQLRLKADDFRIEWFGPHAGEVRRAAIVAIADRITLRANLR